MSYTLRFCSSSLAVLLAALLLAACGRAPEAPGRAAGPQYSDTPAAGLPLYRLAVHPLYNPAKLSQAYQPLVDHLNRHVAGARFELEASRDYAAYEDKLRKRTPELLLPNPLQSLMAMRFGYQTIAMAGDAEDFKGIFIVRHDSPLRTPADLKGKAIACPARTALAACMMPQWFLHRSGLDLHRDIDSRYVGSQESAILGALNGDVAAAATWPTPWRAFQKDHPNQAAQLRVIWETPPLLNLPLMVRNDVPAAVRERVRELLLGLHQSAQGAAVLEAMQTARFHAADDASYAPVREFVARFAREVRTVEAR